MLALAVVSGCTEDQGTLRPGEGDAVPFVQIVPEGEQPTSAGLGVIVRVVAAGGDLAQVGVTGGTLLLFGPSPDGGGDGADAGAGDGDGFQEARSASFPLQPCPDAAHRCPISVSIVVEPDDVEALVFAALVSCPGGVADGGCAAGEAIRLDDQIRAIRVQTSNTGGEVDGGPGTGGEADAGALGQAREPAR